MPSTTSPPSPGPQPDLHHAASAAGWDVPGLLAWLGTGVGFGLLSGWVVGYALKKIALVAALFLGLAFILIQVMVVNRFMTVDWNAVAGFFGAAAKTVSAPNAAWWKVLLNNFPYAGSFGVGFFMGFRKG